MCVCVACFLYIGIEKTLSVCMRCVFAKNQPMLAFYFALPSRHVWNIYYLYTIICMNDVSIKAKTD